MAIFSTAVRVQGATRGNGVAQRAGMTRPLGLVPATLLAGGLTWDVSGFAQRWGGGAIDLDTHAYVTFTLLGDSTLWAAEQENWQTVSGAHDVAPIAWSDAHHDLPLRNPFRPCLPLAARMQIWIGGLASGYADGPRASALLDTPGAMAVSPLDGSLAFVDRNGIRRYDPGSDTVSTILAGSVGHSCLAYAPNGDLYFVGASGYTVLRHGAGTPVFTGIAAAATNINLSVSKDGATLYIGEGVLSAQQIMATNTATFSPVVTFAGSGDAPGTHGEDLATYTDPTANAHPLTAMLPASNETYIAPDGSITVMSTELGSLSRILGDGHVTRITGTGGISPDGEGGESFTRGSYRGDGADATIQTFAVATGEITGPFNHPVGIAVSDCFDFLVACQGEGTIRGVDRTAGTLYTLAGAARINNVYYGPVPEAVSIDSPRLGVGGAVDANAYGLPGIPQSVRAIPRGQGGGAWVSCAPGTLVAVPGSPRTVDVPLTAHCILKLS